MAVFNYVFVVLTVFLVASCDAAPSEDVNVLNVPKECEGKRYCTVKPKGYDDFVKRMAAAVPSYLKQRKDLDSRSSDEVLGTSPESDWDNCPYTTKRESIYQIREDSNSEYDMIVQVPELSQVVYTVTCAHEHINNSSLGLEECYAGLQLNPLGVKTVCETSYARRPLYIYDIHTAKVIQKEFHLPHSTPTSEGVWYSDSGEVGSHQSERQTPSLAIVERCEINF